jgi:hypothetical protein
MPFSSTSQFSIGAAPQAVSNKPLRLKTEALLRSLDHGLCHTDFGLANGAGGLDVNDNAGPL